MVKSLKSPKVFFPFSMSSHFVGFCYLSVWVSFTFRVKMNFRYSQTWLKPTGILIWLVYANLILSFRSYNEQDPVIKSKILLKFFFSQY